MALIDQLQKKFGKDGLFLLEDGENLLSIEKVPTGIRTLDQMLGGGMPLGRIVELSGQEGIGKTSLSLSLCRAYQDAFPDKSVVFIDVEGGNTFDFIVDTYHLDRKRTIYKRVGADDTAERVLDFLETCANAEEVSLVVLDSLASLVSEQDGSKDLNDGFRDNRPQLYSRALRRLTRRPVTSATVVLLNQLRMKQNATPYEDQYYETGGLGIRYYCSLRLRLFHGGTLRDSTDQIQGFMVRASVNKSRYSLPKQSCKYAIDFVEGIDLARAALDTALAAKIIQKSGSWFTLYEKRYQGQNAVLEDLRSNQELLLRLEADLADLPE